MSLNKVTLIGNLGKDPDVRRTQSGDPVVNISVATSEKWRDRHSGEQREQTEWHRVVIFGKTAEIAEKYLRKGSKVYLEGKLTTRKWQDQSGADRYSTEVVLSGFNSRLLMLGERNGGGASNSPYASQADRGPTGGGYGGGQKVEEIDDGIPF